MNPEILKALITAGLVDVNATLGEATAALNAYAQARGKDLPTDLKADSAVAAVKAILTSEANTNNQSEEGALATAVLQTATPLTLQTATLGQSDALSASDIIGMINLTSLSAEQRLELQSELVASAEQLSMQQVMDRINQAQQDNNPAAGATPPERITAGEAELDKFQASARDAILSRTWGTNNLPEQIYNYQTREMAEWNPGANLRNYGLQSLPTLAQQCLMTAGVPAQTVLNLSRHDIARMVMGADPHSIGLGGLFAASDGPAYNVSGMFSNILLDASNVMLRRSYDDARVTFHLWMRQGPAVTDFKAVHKVIAGELSDPQAIPEDGEFEETTLSDGKESYKLTVWGSIYSHAWQLIVNDALGSFTEVPIKQGRSMRRKQNRLCYNVVKDNAVLADGNALFDNTNHSNDNTGAITDYGAELDTMVQKMSEQGGLDADSAALNIEPEFILYPPKLRSPILKEIRSEAPPSATHAGEENIHRNSYTPIQEAELGVSAGGSNTGFYVAASSNVVDTIEYAYLQGLETPVIEQEVAFGRLALRQRIYQAFAVSAIDHRGIQRHTGA